MLLTILLVLNSVVASLNICLLCHSLQEAELPESGTSVKSKTAKDNKAVKRKSGTFSRSPRFLSQSSSFPTRGAHADITRKSIDATSKASPKHVVAAGSKPKATPSSNNGVSTKRTSLVSAPLKKQTMVSTPICFISCFEAFMFLKLSISVSLSNPFLRMQLLALLPSESLISITQLLKMI